MLRASGVKCCLGLSLGCDAGFTGLHKQNSGESIGTFLFYACYSGGHDLDLSCASALTSDLFALWRLLWLLPHQEATAPPQIPAQGFCHRDCFYKWLAESEDGFGYRQLFHQNLSKKLLGGPKP